MLLFLIGLIYCIYYVNQYYHTYITEYPDIYVHPSMEDVLFKMKYLKEKIQWTPWAFFIIIYSL